MKHIERSTQPRRSGHHSRLHAGLVTGALASLLAVPALLSGRVEAAPNCTPARMLMVLDKSSSMTATVDGTGKSKWQLAVEAITGVANTYENKIDLGINIFPNPNQCAPGTTLVEPGPGHASAIISALGAPPPATGNYTPMSQSIDVAAGDPRLQDALYRPALLLVTDGWQWCSPYDASTRTWPIDSVIAARQKGIKVYVVGFGDSVDVWTLNQMANAAGTALPGCNPSNTTTAGNNCYYQADSGAALTAALNTISVTVSAEICDGMDNDCDGLIDEDLVKSCASACGTGTQTCTLGSWGSCSAPSPQTEICDLIDNNCNGVVDEGCACQPGQTSACGGGGLGPCAVAGVQTCLPNGQWSPCSGAGAGMPELCNGLDDDCDGVIDNGAPEDLCPLGFCDDSGMCHANPNTPPPQATPDPCEAQSSTGGCVCVPTAQRACDTFKPVCGAVSGVETCSAQGTWGTCVAAVHPTVESCNGVDDDCDGQVDNEGAAALCPDNWSCQEGLCRSVGPSPERGCGCTVGSSASGAGSLPLSMLSLFVVALALYRRGRRRA